MGKRYVENDTPNTMYVGGMAIAPGEGREVNVPDAPAAGAPFEAEPDPDADLHALLGGNVAAVIASLPGLGPIALGRLTALETDGKNRKGVLAALGDARIALADAALNSDDLGGEEGGDPGAEGGSADGKPADETSAE